MKLLLEILQTWDALRSTGAPATLATVVEVQGSAYRQPGARLLLTNDGRSVGMLSGGCLERDLHERVRAATPFRDPVVITYDTTSPADVVWGLGLGCNGVVRLLVEPANKRAAAALDSTAHWLRTQQTGVIATVYATLDSRAARLGSRLVLDHTGPKWTDIADGQFVNSVQLDAQLALANRRSFGKQYVVGAARASVFIEVIQPPLPLIIFGSGPDVQPLVRFAKELGWTVQVIAPQPDPALASRFPTADVARFVEPEHVPQTVALEAASVVVIMTHNYLHDLALLKGCLPSSAGYVGLLGPVKRREKMLQQLRDEGVVITAEQLARLHNPAGLDLGAESPEEIALSIVAEIQAALSGRAGGFLRQRRGSIHALPAG